MFRATTSISQSLVLPLVEPGSFTVHNKLIDETIPEIVIEEIFEELINESHETFGLAYLELVGQVVRMVLAKSSRFE